MMPEYTPDKVSVPELKALGRYLHGLEEGSQINLKDLPLPGSKKQTKRVIDFFITGGAVSHSPNGPYVFVSKSKLAEMVSDGYKRAESTLIASLAGVEVDMPNPGDISHSIFGYVQTFSSKEQVERLAELRTRATVGLIKIMSRCPNGICREEVLRVHAHKGPYARKGDMYDRETQRFYNEQLETLERGGLVIVDPGETDVHSMFPNGSNIFTLNMQNEKRLVEAVENYRKMKKN